MSGAVVMHQNRLMRRFHEAAANNPKSARSLQDIGCRNSWVFRRMVAKGVFVNTGDDRYYMNEGAARRFVQLRRRTMIIFLAAILFMVVVWLLFAWLVF